jgi:hypothetical protein
MENINNINGLHNLSALFIVLMNEASAILEVTAAVNDVGGENSEKIPRRNAKKWTIHGLIPTPIRGMPTVSTTIIYTGVTGTPNPTSHPNMNAAIMVKARLCSAKRYTIAPILEVKPGVVNSATIILNVPNSITSDDMKTQKFIVATLRHWM